MVSKENPLISFQSLDKLNSILTETLSLEKEELEKEEEDIGESAIFEKMGPLYMRGATAQQIAEIIPDLDIREVTVMAEKLSKPYKSNPNIYLRRFNPKDFRENVEPLSEEGKLDRQKKVVLVREYCNTSFIPMQTECFSEVVAFLKGNNITMPSNFYDLIELEMFYSAVRLRELGDASRFYRYSEIGSKVDSEWFSANLAKEKNQIGIVLRATNKMPKDEDALNRLKSRWGILDKPAIQPSEDRDGYPINNNGKRRSRGGRHSFKSK